MPYEELASIADEDWRLQAITTLAEDFASPFTGILHKVGAPCKLIGHIKFDSKFQLTFSIPNMSALFLDFAYQLELESLAIFKQIEVFLQENKTQGQPAFMEDNIIFDLVEKRMGTIVFAFCALEAFANEYIPDTYIYTTVRDDRKCSESYDKEQIEKTLSLDVKLSNILPDIFKLSSLKSKPDLWTKYQLLKKTRDRVVHCKSIDRRHGESYETTVWKDLLNKNLPNFAVDAKKIIEYFLSQMEEKPRWYEKCLHNIK